MIKNKALAILLTFALFKGLVWAFITPVFQAPDENVHFNLIQYIGENNHHPGPKNSQIISKEIVEVSQLTRFNWMAFHPVWQGLEPNWFDKINKLDKNLKTQFGDDKKPSGQKLPTFYYWLSFPVYKIFQPTSFIIRFYSLRILSVLLTLTTIFLSYLISKEVFKNNLLNLAVASLVAFQPTFSFISSSVSYDVLAILVSTSFLYFSLRFIKTKKQNHFLICLFISIIGILTKTQLISLALVLPFLLNKKRLRFLTPLLLLFPPMIYFNQDYQQTFSRIYTWLASSKTFPLLFLYFKTSTPAFLAEIFPWYWGVFGWLEKIMPIVVYQILKILVGLGVIGLIKAIYQRTISKINKQQLTFLLLFSFISAAVVFFNDFLIFTRTGKNFGVQGRYLLPAITAHMVLLVFGLNQLVSGKTVKKYFPHTLIILSLCLNLVGLYSLIQYFGCPFCL